MEFPVKTTHIAKLSSPCLVIGVYKEKNMPFTASGVALDQACGNWLSELIRRGDVSAEANSTLLLYHLDGVCAERVLLVGLGAQCEFNMTKLDRTVVTAVQTLNQHAIKFADLTLAECEIENIDHSHIVRKIVETAEQSMYQYKQTKSMREKPLTLKKVGLIVQRKQTAATKRAVKQGKAIASGVSLTRDLANLPGNICTPNYLARQARVLQKNYPIKTTVLDEAELKRRKMGALLSVSKGSREPAKLIVMQYKNGRRDDRPFVLVGKGLTFDAGGISLKPAAAMDEMKYDMCGGASVLGTMQSVAELELKVNLVGIIPCSENLPDGAANKPGDVVTSMSGVTIEILNTDAEGRLILCDALTYAERFKPTAVIDIATLTGACAVALGDQASGLFSDDDALAGKLLAAGDASCDRAWRMPVWDEYDPQLKSNFADIANVGGRYAGAITAACFLRRFTRKYSWAHLDIAGTAWKSGKDKGATGRPVPLLVEFLLQQ